MDGPDLIALIIPVWLGLIVLEMLLGKLRGKYQYRLNDTVNSLSLGTMYTITGSVTKFVGIVTYVFVYELALFELSLDDWWVWVVGFIFYDLCYYWNHRMGHEINILWAAHVVHHQSEDYNLSTALRQTSMTFIFSWIFYTPMALLGIPPMVFFVAGALDLIYQFWIHTRHIPKLGWMEKYFVTPSAHRVHHGCNPIYMDRNYGGVFIIWDRAFGSYQEELDSEPVAYGISKPLRNWNPLWANFAVYADLARDARQTRRWRDKLSLWFRRTGWRPQDVAAAHPVATRGEGYSNYDARPDSRVGAYIAVQFIFSNLMGFAFLAVAASQTLLFNSAMAAMFVLQLTLLSRLLEPRPQPLLWELVRLLLVLLTTWYCSALGLLAATPLLLLLASVLLSLPLAACLLRGSGSAAPAMARQGLSSAG